MAKSAREAYEAAVAELANIADTLLKGGKSEEEIARDVVDRRNDLKVQFRLNDPPALVAEMERINLLKYGHPVGPTADQLFHKYNDWTEVIAAACRPARLSRMM